MPSSAFCAELADGVDSKLLGLDACCDGGGDGDVADALERAVADSATHVWEGDGCARETGQGECWQGQGKGQGMI